MLSNSPHIYLISMFIMLCGCKADDPKGEATSLIGLTSPPKLVILFADDLGYGDLGSYGHPSIRTPEIDRLANEGQRWTDFYSVSSVCSPSRGALMTGRQPVKTGLYGHKRMVFFPGAPGGIPAAEFTLAEELKGAGYGTAIFGKWHLGDSPEALPTRHGFDEWLELPYSNDMDWTGGPETIEIMEAQQAGHITEEEASSSFAQRVEAILSPRSEDWDVPLMRSSVVTEGGV